MPLVLLVVTIVLKISLTKQEMCVNKRKQKQEVRNKRVENTRKEMMSRHSIPLDFYKVQDKGCLSMQSY